MTTLTGYTVCVLDDDQEPNHYCYPDAKTPREAIDAFLNDHEDEFGLDDGDLSSIWGVYPGVLGPIEDPDTWA